MKGKSYSIPCGMVFKKYYCSHCGTKLVKSKTHRVVSKDDKDYYQYHEIGYFPKYDYDVYSYEFKCTKCNKKISYSEQCIIDRIQKKLNKIILSSNDIKENYKVEQYKNSRRILIRNIMIPILMLTAFFGLFYLLDKERNEKKIIIYGLIYLILVVDIIFMTIRSYKGKNKLRRNMNYSNEDILRFEKLHTFSSNNKDLIEEAEYCYCFHCKKKVESKEIVNYLEIENTALCPYCGIDAIIPDSIDEIIDSKTIDDMNKYWF